ncbi:MAG: VOC family protein [Rubricoccaceae bacterium]|nr:VOC family protein [Rubricoccaceae bacterium]
MPRVVHFEIHASDPKALKKFYESLFDWTFTQFGDMDYWTIETGKRDEIGINGGLILRQGSEPEDGQPVNAFVCTVGVGDLEATLEKALSLGAQMAVEKMQIPGVGWLAYIKDPDGNILGVMQPDM